MDSNECKTLNSVKQQCDICDIFLHEILYCGECFQWMCKKCAHVHNRFNLLKDHTMKTYTDKTSEMCNEASEEQTVCGHTVGCARDRENAYFCIGQVAMYTEKENCDIPSPKTEPLLQNKWLSSTDAVPHDTALYSALSRDRPDPPYAELGFLSESAQMVETHEDKLYYQDEDTVNFGQSVDQLRNKRSCGDYRMRKGNADFTKSAKEDTLSNIYSDIKDSVCLPMLGNY